MAELEKQVRRVWRRLNFQRFTEILVWCWVAALVVDLCWVVSTKIWPLADNVWRPLVEPWWITVVASLGVGLVAAAVIWFFKRSDAVEAAVALDKAFELKERVSTTLTLAAELRHSSAGLALISDTTQRVEMIDVGEKFGFRLPRSAWIPLVPAAVVFLVATFMGQLSGRDSASASTDVAKEREQVKKVSQVLTKRLEEQQQKAKEQGLGEETQKLLADLAKKAESEIAGSKDLDQKAALSKMNTLQDALKDRREKLGDAAQLQRQLEKLKLSSDGGPADKLEEALKKGDLKTAIDEINKLAEQIKSGKLEPEQQKALAKQLGQMKEQLEKLANIEERKKQLEEQLKKAGLSEEAIKQELAKLDAQAAEMKKLQELAKKLGDAQQNMAKGDMQKAMEALNMSKEDLQQMLKDLQEMESLDMAMDELAELKNAMLCKKCEGEG